MADDEHVAKWREGVAAWNRWREQHVDLIPDLSEWDFNGASLYMADLSRAILCDGSFVRADLRQAKFSESRLNRADLSGSDLSQANLERAQLVQAHLSGADLSEASLSKANLREAFLRGANLNGTELNEADFTGAIFGWTIFGNVNLSSAIGLDAVKHHGPSTIGLDTLLKSGAVPRIFLQGTGVPEALVTQVNSLVAGQNRFYACFISYSTNDQGFADRLYTDLQNRGVRCWFAPEDLKIGDKFRDRIDESIRLNDRLVLILSEHSIESPWVEREVTTAMECQDRERRQVLFPVKIDEAIVSSTKAWAADIRRQYQIADFTRWTDGDFYQKAFERVVRDLKSTANA